MVLFQNVVQFGLSGEVSGNLGKESWTKYPNRALKAFTTSHSKEKALKELTAFSTPAVQKRALEFSFDATKIKTGAADSTHAVHCRVREVRMCLLLFDFDSSVLALPAALHGGGTEILISQ
ncbi:Hypothetical predicted protein, partial [Podarcis lilfordi]